MRSLTPEELQSFVYDGYVVLRDIVPRSSVEAARRTFYQSLGTSLAEYQRIVGSFAKHMNSERDGDELSEKAVAANSLTLLGRHPDICDLVDEETDVRTLIEQALGGPVHGFQFAQMATRFPTEPSDSVTESGYRDKDIPFFGWHGHLDGLWNGSTPPHQDLTKSMSKKAWEQWNQQKGRNGVQRTYPGTGANITNFTALLGIPLSDQSREGVGNLGLLKGAHHPITRFFRHQREHGGPLGPDGPGWERLHREAPNGSGLRHYPDQVREQFKHGAQYTSDGRLWPKPSLIELSLGDAVLTLHAVPHSASRCEGSEPRVMAYFRLTSRERPDHARFNYISGLCDCWHEWKGIRNVVNEILDPSS
ncbi:MAG: hypothetical protein OXG24_10830 [Gammaproteobacteria bacterium]|nr:hypothetical protein [Gammaproteobacteria bacterium]